MVTYRRDLERKGWHRPWPLRIFLVLLGAGCILLGMVLWSLADVYRGDPDFVTHHEVSGPVQVLEAGEVVFEGTQAEVDAWLEGERGSRNLVAPVLFLTAGALAVVGGVAPSPKKGELDVSPLDSVDQADSRPMQLT